MTPGRVRERGADGGRHWRHGRNRRGEDETVHGLPKPVLATSAHVVRIGDGSSHLWSCGGGAASGPSSAAGSSLGRDVHRGSGTSRSGERAVVTRGGTALVALAAKEKSRCNECSHQE